MRRTALTRKSKLRSRTRIRPKRQTPRQRKTTIRLSGAALTQLRWQAFERSGGICEFEGCGEPITWTNSELAHVVSRGAGGSDVLENVQMSCRFRRDRKPGCHLRSHNAGGSPMQAWRKEEQEL